MDNNKEQTTHNKTFCLLLLLAFSGCAVSCRMLLTGAQMLVGAQKKTTSKAKHRLCVFVFVFVFVFVCVCLCLCVCVCVM